MINNNNNVIVWNKSSLFFSFVYLFVCLLIFRFFFKKKESIHLFRMIKNASSSIPMRTTLNTEQQSYNFHEEVLKSPSTHVSMDISNVVTPYQPKTQPQQSQTEKRTKKWCIDDFNIGRRLGEGSYSTVILVEEKKTGFLCALKVIKVYLY